MSQRFVRAMTAAMRAPAAGVARNLMGKLPCAQSLPARERDPQTQERRGP
jgi:hypothetical protein